jgi:hypothetical protein
LRLFNEVVGKVVIMILRHEDDVVGGEPVVDGGWFGGEWFGGVVGDSDRVNAHGGGSWAEHTGIFVQEW